jgi:hypothetical protein
MATVVAGRLRSVTLLSFALRSFASAFFRFVCWAAKAFVANCLSVVAVVESARGLAAPTMVVVPVVSRAVVVLGLALRGSATVSVCFTCGCAAEMSAASILTAVDDGEGACGLVASVVTFGRVVPCAVCVHARALRGRAAVPARFVACGVAAAAVGVVEIVVYDEFSSTLGGEGGVGKLSFVGFFVRPGWL